MNLALCALMQQNILDLIEKSRSSRQIQNMNEIPNVTQDNGVSEIPVTKDRNVTQFLDVSLNGVQVY